LKKREQKEKRKEEKKQKQVKKTASGAIIREVKEDDWKFIAYRNVTATKRKAWYKCLHCNTEVRCDHRRVHGC